MIKFINILKRIVNESQQLNEYPEHMINYFVKNFKLFNPTVSPDVIRAYVIRFSELKESPKILNKDINQYTWEELERVVDSNQPKRIKAGKINDGEPKDANLVYDKNKLRIYVGKTKNACVKYGNKYNFCISSRGDDNLYHDYRFEQQGTPYFIFDDTKTSERGENREFIDPEHLLVLFAFADGEYTITTADNPGERHYEYFRPIEQIYPRLKGLENIFKPVEIDSTEKAEYMINKKYNNELSNIKNDILKKFGENFWISSVFNNIKYLEQHIDALPDLEVYKFAGKLKPTVDEDDYLASKIIQFKLTRPNGIETQYNEFITNTLASIYEGPNIPKDLAKDWDITYEKQDTTDPKYTPYLEQLKKLAAQYRNELSRLKLKV